MLYNSRDFNVFLSLRHVDLDINSTTVEISIFFKRVSNHIAQNAK